jgi:hypothetical protein
MLSNRRQLKWGLLSANSQNNTHNQLGLKELLNLCGFYLVGLEIRKRDNGGLELGQAGRQGTVRVEHALQM